MVVKKVQTTNKKMQGIKKMQIIKIQNGIKKSQKKKKNVNILNTGGVKRGI